MLQYFHSHLLIITLKILFSKILVIQNPALWFSLFWCVTYKKNKRLTRKKINWCWLLQNTHRNIQTHTQSMLAGSDVEITTRSSTKEPKKITLWKQEKQYHWDNEYKEHFHTIKWPGHIFWFCFQQFKLKLVLIYDKM